MANALYRAVNPDLRRALKVVNNATYWQAEHHDLSQGVIEVCDSLGHPISGDLEAQATPGDADVCDLLRHVETRELVTRHRPLKHALSHALRKADDFFLYDLVDHARWSQRGQKIRRFLDDALDRCVALQV
jgi:hypothetical protein